MFLKFILMAMSSRLSVFRFLTVLFATVFSLSGSVASGQDYQQRLNHIREGWAALIPQIADVQYAGNIGVVSVGVGWDYGSHNTWETHLMLGYLPRWQSDADDFTFTLKQNYVPWRMHFGHDVMINPFYVSLFMNSIFDDEFWRREPSKYNGGHYYRFSSKIRTHIALCGRFNYYIPEQKRILSRRVSLYYELSSYDLAILSALPNKKITLGDILCLGVGLQYKFF